MEALEGFDILAGLLEGLGSGQALADRLGALMSGKDIVRTSTGCLFLTPATHGEKLFGDGAAAHGTDGLEAFEDGQTLGFDLLKGIHFSS